MIVKLLPTGPSLPSPDHKYSLFRINDYKLYCPVKQKICSLFHFITINPTQDFFFLTQRHLIVHHILMWLPEIILQFQTH